MTMESELNEYCLNYIFSYLKPHDLIHVSQVCKLWKQVAQRQWRKITEIFIYENDKNDQKAEVIPAAVAEKIFYHAAQFVRVLRVFDEKCGYFMFVNHCYKLEESFDADTILEFLIRSYATEVIEATFNCQPKADLMRSFLQNNKVKKLSYDDYVGYHRHIPTGGIEDLTINFYIANKHFRSFEGHFPNLKKLNLNIKNENDNLNISADFYKKGLQSLMLLPDLEVLNIKLPEHGFPSMVLPEMKNLSSLKFTFDSSDRNVAGIFEAVKMMPKLQNIDFGFSDEISEESQLQFICSVVRAAILLGKDVLLSKSDPDEADKILKVERKTGPQNADLHQTLHFRFRFSVTKNEKALFQGVHEFVRNELRDYHVLIVYYGNEWLF